MRGISRCLTPAHPPTVPPHCQPLSLLPIPVSTLQRSAIPSGTSLRSSSARRGCGACCTTLAAGPACMAGGSVGYTRECALSFVRVCRCGGLSGRSRVWALHPCVCCLSPDRRVGCVQDACRCHGPCPGAASSGEFVCFALARASRARPSLPYSAGISVGLTPCIAQDSALHVLYCAP